MVFEAKKKGDYHENMCAERFMRWLREQFVPAIRRLREQEPELKVLLIMDNARYHNSLTGFNPKSLTKKQLVVKLKEMKQEVPENWESRGTKSDLIERFQSAVGPRSRIVDEYLKQFDIATLRLPPYPPDLNPI